MTAAVLDPCSEISADCHDQFLPMLPRIEEQADFAFRTQAPELREELVAEVVANAFVAFKRLVTRGLSHVAFATPLAKFAIRKVRAGYRVGTKLNVRDVTSEYAQQRKAFKVARLDRFDARKGEWREVVVEDRKAGPADTAAARMDIADWLAGLPKQKRRVAETLASGETTKSAAKRFRLSPGRISQMRRELERGWQGFQGQALPGLACHG